MVCLPSCWPSHWLPRQSFSPPPRRLPSERPQDRRLRKWPLPRIPQRSHGTSNFSISPLLSSPPLLFPHVFPQIERQHQLLLTIGTVSFWHFLHATGGVAKLLPVEFWGRREPYFKRFWGFDTMYNIFVFPLEILLNLIVLFLDKSWIFSKKIRRRTVCYTYCGGFISIGYSESASLLPHKQNPFPDFVYIRVRTKIS